MEDNYITNMDISNIEDDDDKISQLRIELEEKNNEIKDLTKSNLEMKHKIEELENDNDSYLRAIKNQNGLNIFYKKYRTEYENNTEKNFIRI